MRLLSWFIFVLIVIFEGVITSLPITLIFLLCLTVMKRQRWIFTLAFVAGILLDVFAFRPIGTTSLYFVIFTFLMLLYQRKYETATKTFVIITSFFGSVGYLLSSGQSDIFLQAILSTLIAGGAFSIYRSLNQPTQSEGFLHV